MLKIENLCKIFNQNTTNENKVFQGLNIEVNKGDFITLIGSNGAGKSTFLNIIAGTLKEDSGYITINNKNIEKLPEYKRSKYIGRVFQDTSKGIALNLSIIENLSLAFNKGKAFDLSFCISKKNINMFKEKLAQLNLGLEDKLNTKVGLLSGGQRQALCLLIAVMNKPELLLLDEHTAALDPKATEIILDLTEKMVKENNITTLMVTHNLNNAVKIGNRIIMMHRGDIILDLRGKEKEKLTVDNLIENFDKAQGMNFISDRMLLS
ncbi:ABC transporter ATP-binding protein [Candidatus Clostridium radicumherbarum]|uniref:ABC transporter ATP-binding protein n=1 Tax=Candidatus Clostridium radicumherbarum TaxID=3381662 RepID=A0ABW8TTB2_9CLOT